MQEEERAVFFNKAVVLYLIYLSIYGLSRWAPLSFYTVIVFHLPHSTAGLSSPAATTNWKHYAPLDSAALLSPSWKDAATSFPLASAPRSISSLLTSAATVSPQSPQGRQARVAPPSDSNSSKAMWCPSWCLVLLPLHLKGARDSSSVHGAVPSTATGRPHLPMHEVHRSWAKTGIHSLDAPPWTAQTVTAHRTAESKSRNNEKVASVLDFQGLLYPACIHHLYSRQTFITTAARFKYIQSPKQRVMTPK